VFAIDVTGPYAGYSTGTPRLAAYCEFRGGGGGQKKEGDG